jgi:hypothetical protein
MKTLADRRRRRRVQLDWDTVELVGQLTPLTSSAAAAMPSTTLTPPQPTPLTSLPVVMRVKRVLAGASMRARSRGAQHTHSRLLRLLRGMDLFAYAWSLIGAVAEDDLELAIEKAALAIERTSRSCVAR